MDWSLILVYALEKATDPALFLLALVVGTVINLYGQILVPRLRGLSPVAALRAECKARPFLLAVSVTIAFFFPFTVGLVSGVATRYTQRHIEAHATFPDAKPDPVFRVDLNGHVISVGARTAAIRQPHRDGSTGTGRPGVAGGSQSPRGRDEHRAGQGHLL